MKPSFKIVLLTLGLTTLAFTGCKKYEEGPALSLRSKKARLAGSWTVEKATTNGTDVTSYYADVTLTFEKEGNYTVTFGSLADQGTWEFINDKEDLRLTDASSNDSDTSNVLRLTNKELWTKVVSGSNTTEVHYKAK